MDELTLTLRLYDPKEKEKPELAASWATVKIPREDLKLAPEEFAAKHLIEAVRALEHFKQPA